jgi:hypothetical protein
MPRLAGRVSARRLSLTEGDTASRRAPLVPPARLFASAASVKSVGTSRCAGSPLLFRADRPKKRYFLRREPRRSDAAPHKTSHHPMDPSGSDSAMSAVTERHRSSEEPRYHRRRKMFTTRKRPVEREMSLTASRQQLSGYCHLKIGRSAPRRKARHARAPVV